MVLENLPVVLAGLLIGCGRKWEILQQERYIMRQIMRFFKSRFNVFLTSRRRKPMFLLSNGQLEHKKMMKVSKLNQLLPLFNYFNLK